MKHDEIVVSAPTFITFVGSERAKNAPILYAAFNKRVVAKTTSLQSGADVYPNTMFSKIGAFLEKKKVKQKKVKVSVGEYEEHLFGWETAIVVAVIASIYYLEKRLWNPYAINQLAFDFLKETVSAAGGAVTVATFGGFVWERHELSFLNSIWQLPLKLSVGMNSFYLTKSKMQSAKKSRLNFRLQEFVEALKRHDPKWLTLNFSPYPVGGNWSLDYNKQVVPSEKDMICEKIFLGEEGIRLEQKHA